MPASGEQWRAELDAAIEKVSVALCQPILATAASWKESSTITDDALAVANPDAVLAAAEQRLDGVLRFACKQYKSLYARAQEGNREFQTRHENTLRGELNAALSGLRPPLGFYYGIQQQVRAHIDEQSGLGKIAGNFIRGYLGDPTVLFEGLLEVFGEGPAARKMKELLERDQHAATALGQAIDLAVQRLDSVIVNWWNNTVLPEINEQASPEEPESASVEQRRAHEEPFSFAPAMVLLVLALSILTAGHWVVVAIFYPSVREVTVPPAEQPAVFVERQLGVLAAPTVARLLPNPLAKKTGPPLPRGEYLVVDDPAAPPGWLKIEIGTDSHGWILAKGVKLKVERVEKKIPLPPPTVEKQQAFYFGRPTFLDLLQSFRPLWIYVVGGVLGLLLLLLMIATRAGFAPPVGYVLLAPVVGHAWVQGITFAILRIWGTPI